jgi:hypothetical protein
MRDLLITVKHLLLVEFNISNDGYGMSDQPFQAECRDELCGILNEFFDNDKDDADLTYETKMQQLIDRVLSYNPPSASEIDPLTETMMGAKMNADVASCEDAANSSSDYAEPNALALEVSRLGGTRRRYNK